jgi:hypothetical protein
MQGEIEGPKVNPPGPSIEPYKTDACSWSIGESMNCPCTRSTHASLPVMPFLLGPSPRVDSREQNTQRRQTCPISTRFTNGQEGLHK